jgi:hypothetical protein
VKNLYEDCLKLEGMKLYFPNSFPKGRTCDRSYFFSILASLHPDYTNMLILNCKKVRNDVNSEDMKKETILIDSEWEALLKEFPQFSSKLQIFK